MSEGPTPDPYVEHVRAVLESRMLGASVSTRIGRFVVLDRIGAGAMGVVYAARDEELDREIAIKLLRTELGLAGVRERLLREARSMARLSHPNVAVVHEIGTHEGQAFVAMEFIAGATLRQWQSLRAHPWTEILAAYQQAARGLAAAHDASVVHRDFKPDNAMIDERGIVKVMDFGLARLPEHDELADATLRSGSEQSDDPLATPLTRAGALVGTPAYMAPEQLAGRHADARSDQFAFFVALHEALFGARPFTGKTIAELEQAIAAGSPRPRRRGNVPRWLGEVIARGLAADPSARWPTMTAVLEAIDRGGRRARVRRILAGVAVVGAVAGAVVGGRAFVEHQRVRGCEQIGAAIASIWNDEARASVRDGLVASGASFAEITADRVMPWLDAHAGAWQTARTDVCLAESSWDPSIVDRATWCLEENEVQLEALVDRLARADEQFVQSAVVTAAGLPRVESCLDHARLARLPDPPREAREEIRAVQQDIAHAVTLAWAGKSSEGLAIVEAARERADALGWLPLTALATVREAYFLDQEGRYADAERTATEGYFLAIRAGAWGTAGTAASMLITIVGIDRERPDEGLVWARHAEMALEQADDLAGLGEAERLNNLASLRSERGDYREALDLNRRAMDIRLAALGPDHPAVAWSANNLGVIHDTLGESEEARVLYEQALSIRERTHGPEHPFIVSSLTNLAIVHFEAGDYAATRPLLERALTVGESAHGPDHPALLSTLSTLGSLHWETGDLAGARAFYERALAITERTYGPDHVNAANFLHNLGNVHYDQEQLDEALALYERALAISERAFGPDHPEVALALYSIANVYADTGRHALARPLYERALAIRERALGVDHASVATILSSLAVSDAAEGDHARALPLLQRAIAIYDAHDGEQHREPDTRFAYAKSLVATGGSASRACREVARARASFAASQLDRSEVIAEIDAWERAHADACTR